MAWVWHDEEGYAYDACADCLRVGRVVHLASVGGRVVLIEDACRACAGLGYRSETARRWDDERAAGDPDPGPPSPEQRAVRLLLHTYGCCPDCLGAGQHISCAENGSGRVVIAAAASCPQCAGTGRR